MTRHLLDGSSAEAVQEAAASAEWAEPETLSAVLVPESQVRPVLGAVSGATIAVRDAPGLEGLSLLLVPDAHGRSRAALLRAVRDREAVVGPARP
ncbi:hypothetical protein [Nocardioides marinus]|uniref:Uncharacterized protein n=1 Tax=Nocardioides marinus TaxID=374514 RepID=A0A7Y9YIU9_9ACTN|nr:hypothetical protein [Nocardioides marinus]NYI11839.1 hypothetical protein [Nocardioides marinus]